MDGTCQWITRRQDYSGWLKGSREPQTPQTFWLVGLPATGKTMLASAVVSHLQTLGEDCQYHFFSSGHQAKRTAAYCLRSLASQLAFTNREFRQRLLDLHDESGIAFTSQNENFTVIWDTIFEGIIFKLSFQKPLFWVLDAVDEADSQSLLLNHLLKIERVAPFRFFLTSRPMKIPSTYVSPIITCFLSKDDTMEDIRAFIHSTIRDTLPVDLQVQEDITTQLLSKASGSFLWVRLALETVRDNWHTQDDIQMILTQVPSGMEPLYKRMLDMIKALSTRSQLMAKRILTWAACCWKPLSLAELHIALEPEFKGFVSLEDTIVQICGHFISVDNSRVSFTHITARQYLLHDTDISPAFINGRQGHEHIAKVCLRYLSNEKWRRVFKDVDRLNDIGRSKSIKDRLLLIQNDHPFLGYASRYWAYHVAKSSVHSQELISTLKRFLNRYLLSWLEGIALSGNLHYITRSAQHLKTYITGLRRLNFDYCNSSLTLTGSLEDDTNTFQMWANDFIRIVGRFGPSLLQSPWSIYRLVPPFCPPASMIGKTYSTTQVRTVFVTGLPSDGWDDCLASVSVGDETASKVVATEAYFITLICSTGTVIIWHAETCHQARRLQHNEYVLLMALNRSRVLLATADIHNYRVWDISSGKQLYRLSKATEALTMAISFGSTDTELVVGLDDCSVTCYDLETSQAKWQFVAQDPHEELCGCPGLMVFSPCLRKVAIAWRGKVPAVWDMTAPQDQHPHRCRITSSTDALCAAEQVEWQTDGDSILILCQNTKLVEWQLYEEERVEYDHLNAREMTISQDGNLLLTSDNMGVISVWTFPRLHLLYRLLNRDELIRDLTFSPDGQRFYDTRGSICNVWEPAALVRSDEYNLEDQPSCAESCTATELVISNDESSQIQVTALACEWQDEYFCCGREDGTVSIHEAIEGKKLRKVYSHASTSSIIALAWSRSSKYMISSDDSGRIIGKRLELKEVGKWGVFPVLDFRLNEPVQQFLFNPHENLLLISARSTDRVWDLQTKREVCAQQWGQRQSRRWVQHPSNTELLVWIDPAQFRTHNWVNLEQTEFDRTSHTETIITTKSPSQTEPTVLTETHGRVVHWIALTGDERYIIFETGPDSSYSGRDSFEGLQLDLILTSDLQARWHLASPRSHCMSDLAGHVKRLIGTYQDRIVFLHRDHWLCTWKINTGISDVKRHFFLPRDWLNSEALQLADLNSEGTFFCPRYGNVAIVRHGIRL